MMSPIISIIKKNLTVLIIKSLDNDTVGAVAEYSTAALQ